MKLICANCPIEWNSPDFKCKLTVGNALHLLAQYSVVHDFVEEDICQTCRYINFGNDVQTLKSVYGH